MRASVAKGTDQSLYSVCYLFTRLKFSSSMVTVHLYPIVFGRLSENVFRIVLLRRL